MESDLVNRNDNVYENIKITEKIADFESRQQQKKRSKLQRQLEKFILHNKTMIFISVITLLVLYADDFRNIFCNKYQDVYVDCIIVMCMLIFVLEMIIQIMCLQDYLWSFFFWLDLVSILSMPLDIYFIV